MNDLAALYKYLQAKGKYDGKIPVGAQDMMDDVPKYIKTSVSDYTILEIFKHLHTLREPFR